MIDFVQVGKRITSLRRSFDLSQEDLANKLYVTRQCISKWELGISVPSLDMIIEMTKLFSVTIDELLCLDLDINVNSNNIFIGHNRAFIIKKMIDNELDINIPDVFYQLSNEERLVVLKEIKEGNTKCNLNELLPKLTDGEKRFLGGILCKNY